MEFLPPYTLRPCSQTLKNANLTTGYSTEFVCSVCSRHMDTRADRNLDRDRTVRYIYIFVMLYKICYYFL